MATIVLDRGVNEREPTLIDDGHLQDCDGAEYRVGQVGVYVARGRDLVGTVSGVTGLAIYEAAFDGRPASLLLHSGSSLHAADVAASLTFVLNANLTSGTSAMVGVHYANRHYLAFNSQNLRVENSTGTLAAYPIGMSRSTFVVAGASATVGTTGSMSATTGLAYWVTEYDSVRGIESMTGSSAHTGSFSGVTSVIVTVTGSAANSRADQLRWYRSSDGGGFPDGGLIQTTAIGTTQITDTNVTTASLPAILYGIVSVGGLDVERDEPPPPLSTIFGPFQDSLLGVDPDDQRVLKFTPAGYPDSWPSAYGLPLETARRDEIVTGVVLPGRVGVFCLDSVHVIYRLPRDSDSVFAAGEAMDVLTDAKGCVSRRGATAFSPPGIGMLAAWVARDGICVSDLASSPVIVTDLTDWEGRVDVSELGSCRLVDDTTNRRLVFLHRRATDTTYSTGVWYLDYQRFQEAGLRITFSDHGPLADAVTIAWTDGLRRLASADSRSGNGKVYVESTQDVDDSQLRDSAGSVRFRMRTKEFMPAGAAGTVSLGDATWMHDAGPPSITHRFYFNRRDDNPEVKALPTPDTRNASSVILGRNVNSASIEIESIGTVSYGVHWVDIAGLDVGDLGGREGA